MARRSAQTCLLLQRPFSGGVDSAGTHSTLRQARDILRECGSNQCNGNCRDQVERLHVCRWYRISRAVGQEKKVGLLFWNTRESQETSTELWSIVDRPRSDLLTTSQGMSVLSKVPEVGKQSFDWRQSLACDDDQTEVPKLGNGEAR